MYSLLVLWGIVTFVFFLFNVVPSDPARLTLGQRSDIATIENVRKELHLDKSISERYFRYMNDLLPIGLHQKDELSKYHYYLDIPIACKHILIKQPYLGRSYQSKRLVSEQLWEALPGTFVLAFVAMLFATVMGIALGVIAGVKKGTVWDGAAIFTSIIGISTPSFFMGLVVAYFIGFKAQTLFGLPMTGSMWEYDLEGKEYLSIRNLILPAFTLGIRPLAIIAQLTRSALLDTLHQDFIRTAYAKGLKQSKVIFRHALPNAINPVVTAISGWFAELMAGSFFIEYIFGWKGIGKLTVDALDKMDFPIVMGAILVSATIFVFVNLLTDILYTKIDPRMKLES
jgi:peptide/nickel transport system permease protein